MTLLAGAAVLGVSAALHPTLPVDVVGQLDVIGRTTHWQAIHVTMVVGSLLVICGVWALALARPPALRPALIGVFVAVAAGFVLNASNVAFMASMGRGEAMRFAQGHQEMVAAFGTAHAMTVECARVGNALVAVACIVLAVIEWRDQHEPRYMAVLAGVAAVGGIIGVTAFDPASRAAVAGVALFSLWAAVAAGRLLLETT
jgi:hypothetical protein